MKRRRRYNGWVDAAIAGGTMKDTSTERGRTNFSAALGLPAAEEEEKEEENTRQYAAHDAPLRYG